MRTNYICIKCYAIVYIEYNTRVIGIKLRPVDTLYHNSVHFVQTILNFTLDSIYYIHTKKQICEEIRVILTIIDDNNDFDNIGIQF